MKTHLLRKGKFDLYSFRDLEYGIVLMHKEIKDINIAISIVKRMFMEEIKVKELGKHEKDRLRVTLKPFNDRKEGILDAIAKCEDEILDRLLTGNDDGAVEQELLGANYV